MKAVEAEAMERAAKTLVQWRRGWHDGGGAFDPVELAAVRKAAGAFHKVIGPLLQGGGVNGTRARLLCRMQEAYLHRAGQADYLDQLQAAYRTALLIDTACAKDVAQGRKKDKLVYVWIFHAADLWPGKPPAAAGRFGDALLHFQPADLPAVGRVERIADPRSMWRTAGGGGREKEKMGKKEQGAGHRSHIFSSLGGQGNGVGPAPG